MEKMAYFKFLTIAHFLLVDFLKRNFHEQIQTHFQMDALSQFVVFNTNRHNKQIFKLNLWLA